jgi:hypothetical protein
LNLGSVPRGARAGISTIVRPHVANAEPEVVTIDDGYLAAQGSIVRERLKEAAIRLAAILNVALTPGF